MTSYIKIITLLIAGTLTAAAQVQQDRRTSDRSFFNYPKARFVPRQAAPAVSTVAVAAPARMAVSPPCDPDPADTMEVALYRDYVKQNGWMRGRGKPISQETARHLSQHYRLSRKNKAGHWTRFECLDAWGRPDDCGATYLINPYDKNDKQVDEDWRDKLKKIVYWEFVGDVSGENCLQENAYNKEGELILSYITVPVGDNKFMGHYVDARGLPAKMRDEDGAKFVLIQRDQYGYDADISYIGDDGYYKKNIWGAYRSRNIFDKRGYKLRNMSANVDGQFMIDRAGNSGQQQVYDNDGFVRSVTNIDDHGNIIRIPLNESTKKDFICERYEYDQWGRNTYIRYYLADGITPDTITGAVHAYRYEYNDRGKCTLIQCLGLDGKPITDRTGFSMTRREFDDLGNETLFECRNAEGLYFNNDICLALYKYDGDRLVENRDYKTTDGRDTVLTFHLIRNGNTETKILPESDWKQVYVYDDNGDIIEKTFTAIDGTPQDCNKGYQHMRITQQHQPGQCVIEECYWDETGKLADPNEPSFSYLYNRIVTIVDTLQHTKTFLRYDNDKLLSQFQQQLSSDFNIRTGERSFDAMGQHARSHLTSGLFVNSTPFSTVKGGSSTAYVKVTNEYDEVSYRMSDDGNSPVVYAFDPYGESYYVDEHRERIESQKDLRRRLPRAHIIEVYDSIALRLGVQSGDVIMEYGYWKYPELETSNYYDFDLREATFELYNQPKRMVVMRRNPQTNQPEVHTVMLPKGTLADYGFYFHRIFCTEREKQRYDNAYSQWQASQPAVRQPKQKKYKEDRYPTQFMSPLRSDGNSKNVYGRGTVDDAVILALAVQDKRGHIHTYQLADSIEVFDSCRTYKSRDIQRMWYTTDLRTVRSLDLVGSKPSWDARLWYSTKDQRLSRPLQPLRREALQQMQQYVSQWQTAYRDSMQTLYNEAWRAVENDSVIVRYASIDGDGYMAENGYKDRHFIVLEFCGWTCLDDRDDFSSTLVRYRQQPKHVVLVGIETKDDVDFYTDVVEINSDASRLGMKIKPIKVSYRYARKNIFDRYKQWKEHIGDGSYDLPLRCNHKEPSR